VPAAFAQAGLTVHIPRRPYTQALPGIPTIRVFEALACGVPLVCAPWSDREGLFPTGSYLTARNADEMTAALALLLLDRDLASDLAKTGLHAIREHHNCGRRVHQLLAIIDSLARPPQRSAPAALQREALAS
jgi:spore maturation protein CgeB